MNHSEEEESEDGDSKSGNGNVASGGGSTRSQSRIDRWKAKHEAMLKLAEEGKVKKGSGRGKKKEKVVQEVDDDIPEIPNIDPNGVCIDIKDTGNGAEANNVPNKPHTRHSAAVQQALSV